MKRKVIDGLLDAEDKAAAAGQGSRQVAELRAELEAIRRELQALRLLIATQPADATPAEERGIGAKLDLLDRRARNAEDALR